MSFPRHDVTQLLAAVSGGDSHAAAELLPLLYEELRTLARSQMGNEAAGGQGQTLQPTALVHEAYLRLVGGGGGSAGEGGGGKAEVQWDSRGHFFAAAARAMRRILVERARSRGRVKRGGQDGKAPRRVELADGMLSVEPPSTDLLALDDALDKLERYDPRKNDVVMLRYFAGLSIEETSLALNLSPATIKNEWTFARAWLHRELSGAAEGGPPPAGGGA